MISASPSVETLAPPSAGEDFVLTLWTDDPQLAHAADAAGIDRVGLDLERLGKVERQGRGSLWLSSHRESSLRRIRSNLRRAKLFVRTNPPHSGWHAEVERLLVRGAQIVMLPAFSSVADVARGLELLDGRAQLVPLIETDAALEQVDRIAALPGIAELHFGLNDLSLALGVPQRFRLLIDPRIERAAAAAVAGGARLGLGGIGRHDDRSLPVPPDLIYAQQARLGSGAALIARSFLNGIDVSPARLKSAVAAARARLIYWYSQPPRHLAAARDALAAALDSAL